MSAEKVIVTMLMNGSLKNKIVPSIIQQPYKHIRISLLTYLEDTHEEPNQERFDVEFASFLESGVEWGILHHCFLVHVSIEH